jgi:hypothetical protein
MHHLRRLPLDRRGLDAAVAESIRDGAHILICMEESVWLISSKNGSNYSES